MPLFELEEGRLVPAQFGRTVEGALSDEVLESVRAQVLEIVARPLFPVTWRDLSRGGSDDGPRLTALDATGQVVAIEVVDHLTSQRLIAALSALADTAAKSWTDLANEYPGGIPKFRVDWLTFRDSMPPSPGAGPRLIMVVGSIDPSARAALEVLVASGVEVHELTLRRMANGRSFLAVNPVGRRVYAHTPQIVGQSADVPVLEASEESSEKSVPDPMPAPEPESASVPELDPAHGSEVVCEPDSSAVASYEPSVTEKKDEHAADGEAKPHPQSPRRDPHAYRHTAPVYPRVGRSSGSVSRVEEESPSQDSAAVESEVEKHRFEFPSRLSRRVGESERTSPSSLFPPRRGDLGSPQRLEREVPEHLLRRGRHGNVEARARDAAPDRNVPVAIEPNGVGLEALALVFGQETRLYLSAQGSEHVPVVLTKSGLLRVWHREFASLDEAMAYAGCRGVDAWEALHVKDVNGQTLGQALQDLNAAVADEGGAR